MRETAKATRQPRRARSAVLVLTALLFVGTSACSNDSKAFCDQMGSVVSSANQLKTAVDNRDVDAARTAAQQTKADVDKLPSSAKEQIDPQVQALKTALQTLNAAIEGAAKSGDPKNNLGPVSAGVSGVQVAIDSLKSAASC